MSFASDSGYTPATFQTLMSAVMLNVNAQFGTAYTDETFIGTNHYKYFYAMIQKLQENEVKTSEIFKKVQDYFAITNEKISRPVGTNPGLIAALAALGYTASIKKPIVADAGKLYVAVNIDETQPTYAAKKLAINTLLKTSVAGGIVTQGSQSNAIALTNGQVFDFKFNLPNRITPKLRLTITLSSNNQVVIGSTDSIKERLMQNIAARYQLGRNFEPQKYYTTIDAPWASIVKLEYSLDNGATWSSAVYVANYDDLFVITLANIEIIEG